jgi:hypothetical protein
MSREYLFLMLMQTCKIPALQSFKLYLVTKIAGNVIGAIPMKTGRENCFPSD